MMVGLLLLSVAELRAGRAVRGGVLFAVLLQLKHRSLTLTLTRTRTRTEPEPGA